MAQDFVQKQVINFARMRIIFSTDSAEADRPDRFVHKAKRGRSIQKM
jgi:hypothetical protein